MKAMTIGQLAGAANVPPRTIRFYETKRLLPAPKRAPSGYRLYGSDDLKRLKLIRRARSLGFSLTEVRDLLRLAEHEKCPSFQGEVAQRMIQKLDEVDRMIEALHRTRRELEDSLKALRERNEGDCQQAVLDCECKCLGA